MRHQHKRVVIPVSKPDAFNRYLVQCSDCAAKLCWINCNYVCLFVHPVCASFNRSNTIVINQPFGGFFTSRFIYPCFRSSSVCCILPRPKSETASRFFGHFVCRTYNVICHARKISHVCTCDNYHVQSEYH